MKKGIKTILIILTIMICFILIDTMQAKIWDNSPIFKVTEDFNGGSLQRKDSSILVYSYIYSDGTQDTVFRWEKYSPRIGAIVDLQNNSGDNDNNNDYDNVDDKDTVTIIHTKGINLEKVYSFAKNTTSVNPDRKEDYIKIINYTIEGDPIITEVKFVMSGDENYYEITRDTTADKFGEQKVETKKYYNYSAKINSESGDEEFLLIPINKENVWQPQIHICMLPEYKGKDNAEFIGTIIEEGDNYLLVEPNTEEYERQISSVIKVNVNKGDMVFGTNRKVLIYYNGNIEETKTPQITASYILVDGYEDFEISVKESEENQKVKILNSNDLCEYDYAFDLYFYGLDEVKINVNGKEMLLEEALKDGYTTLDGIVSKANRDVKKTSETYEWIDKISGGTECPYILPEKTTYRDGGSTEYKYENYTIIKCHTVEGNRDLYICKQGTKLSDLGI